VPVTAASNLVPAMLQEYGAVTRVALCDYLRPREPQRHLYNMVADYPRRGGRMLRPSLCIATARVFGASIEEAVRSAVALELLHNAFLVHDDVEDESDARRGQPTLHALHGVPVAVNVGDALTLLGLRALIDNRTTLGPWLTTRVLEEAEQMVRESIEGQAVELGWRRDNALDLTDADYLSMVLKKTCWYTTIFPSRVGALIGTRGGCDLDRFVRFGFFLGAAFQIQDDLLNLAGDEARYGKEINGDVWEGKRTLMLIHLLRAAVAGERSRLGEFLARPRSRRTSADVQWVRQRMDSYGCLDYARQVAHGLAGAALHEYSCGFGDVPDSPDKRFIEALVTWVIERA
jgi:geranylgeranyl diphosphate synthase type II